MNWAFLFCSLAIFFFSTLEFVGKLIGTGINPLAVTVYRFMLGSIFLLIPAIYQIRKTKLKLSGKDLLLMSVPGILNTAISMYLLQLSVFYGKALIAAIIISSNSVFVSIFAYFILKEKMSKSRVIGIITGIAGMLFVIAGNAGEDRTPAKSISLGVIFAIAAAIFFALYTVLSKKMIKSYGNIVYNSVSFFSGAVVLMLIGFMLNVDYSFKVNLVNIGSLVYLGFIVTGLAYFFYAKGLEKIPASSSSMFFLLKPVFASILAVLILRESFSYLQACGLILILAGLSLEYVWENLYKKGSD
jgi:drug/metabolite transporter (DMT)-like permease